MAGLSLFCPVYGPDGEELGKSLVSVSAGLQRRHDFRPMVTRSNGNKDENKVVKVYCGHCLEVRELNG